jgi:hypothetical protein
MIFDFDETWRWYDATAELASNLLAQQPNPELERITLRE